MLLLLISGFPKSLNSYLLRRNCIRDERLNNCKEVLHSRRIQRRKERSSRELVHKSRETLTQKPLPHIDCTRYAITPENLWSHRKGYISALRRVCNPEKRLSDDPAFIDGFVLRFISEYEDALLVVNGYTSCLLPSPLYSNALGTNGNCEPGTRCTFNFSVREKDVLHECLHQQNSSYCEDYDSDSSDSSNESSENNLSLLNLLLKTRKLSDTIYKNVFQEGAVNGPYAYSWVIGNETGNFYSQCKAMDGKRKQSMRYSSQESQVLGVLDST